MVTSLMGVKNEKMGMIMKLVGMRDREMRVAMTWEFMHVEIMEMSWWETNNKMS